MSLRVVALARNSERHAGRKGTLMSSLGETVVDAVIAAIPEAVSAQIRYAGDDSALNGSISTVSCSGVEDVKTVDEQGRVAARQGIMRYKKTDEPSAWSEGEGILAIMGELVDVMLPGETEWDNATTLRVRNRLEQAGMVRLDVQAVNETV